MNKRQLSDAGFVDHPHEVQNLGHGVWRCTNCHKMGDKLDLLAHAIRSQPTVLATR